MDQQPRLEILNPVSVPESLSLTLGASDSCRDALQIELRRDLLVKEEMLEIALRQHRRYMPYGTTVT